MQNSRYFVYEILINKVGQSKIKYKIGEDQIPRFIYTKQISRPDSTCIVQREGTGVLQNVRINSNSFQINIKNSFYESKGSQIKDFVHFNINVNDTNTNTLVYSLKMNVLNGQNLLTIDQIQTSLFPNMVVYAIITPRMKNSKNIVAQAMITQNRTIRYMTLFQLNRSIVSIYPTLSIDTNSIIYFGFELKPKTVYSVQLKLYTFGSRYYVLDHKRSFKSPNNVQINILENTGRTVHVNIRGLCLPYSEVKGLLTFKNETVKARYQCDSRTNQEQLVRGECVMVFKNLIPEQLYTLTIRSTCEIHQTKQFLYASPINFTFVTDSSYPDIPDRLELKGKRIQWNNQSYLGYNHSFDLFSCIDNCTTSNWTQLYSGHYSYFDLPSFIFSNKSEVINFRLYSSNSNGRNLNYTRLEYYPNYFAVKQTFYEIEGEPGWLKLIIISLAVTLILMILFGVIPFCCYVRKMKLYRKLKSKYIIGDESDKELENLRSSAYAQGLKTNILYTWNHIPTSQDVAKLPSIQRCAINLNRMIGRGAFGEVYAGSWNQPTIVVSDAEQIPLDAEVAIKTLLKTANETQRLDFLKEAMIMNQFSHNHIIKLLGVCLDVEPKFLILQYMNEGDLQNYLRRSRPNVTKLHQLSYDDCIDIALQIADGCCYLENLHYVHRDLAARNCLVEYRNGQRTIKIGDFGLARDIYRKNYYRKTGEALLPVRWMSPESLLDAMFTIHSDVWSFGIVLWEIITLGQAPYQGMNNQQVVTYVSNGSLLEKPKFCTSTLYDVMLRCWRRNPKERLTFKMLYQLLTHMLDPEAEKPSKWFTEDLQLLSNETCSVMTTENYNSNANLLADTGCSVVSPSISTVQLDNAICTLQHVLQTIQPPPVDNVQQNYLSDSGDYRSTSGFSGSSSSSRPDSCQQEHNQFISIQSSAFKKMKVSSFQLIDDSDYIEGDYTSHSDIVKKQNKNDENDDDKLFYPTRPSKLILVKV
ncbi:unnamed protein product [Didymodactylos carnosus]|uniref:receptor protein-tyrosine kinase n=1 Tax=Didymodactylos carnosus TaxID=1234261 RepID=A0A8S2DNT8_9BILA|nr:unnamed protein product [Didymodactylos carnosus]CAF3764583.1 unnamed protein product [Didymodactylos carnosus]